MDSDAFADELGHVVHQPILSQIYKMLIESYRFLHVLRTFFLAKTSSATATCWYLLRRPIQLAVKICDKFQVQHCLHVHFQLLGCLAIQKLRMVAIDCPQSSVIQPGRLPSHSAVSVPRNMKLQPYVGTNHGFHQEGSGAWLHGPSLRDDSAPAETGQHQDTGMSKAQGIPRPK